MIKQKFIYPLCFLTLFLFCPLNHASENNGLNVWELESLREIQAFESQGLNFGEEEFFSYFFNPEGDEFNSIKGEWSYETASSKENLNSALKDRINIKIKGVREKTGIVSSFTRDANSEQFKWAQGALGYDLSASSFSPKANLIEQLLIGHYKIQFLENKIKKPSLGSSNDSSLRGLTARLGFRPFGLSAFWGQEQTLKRREFLGFAPRSNTRNLDFGSIFIVDHFFKDYSWSVSLKFKAFRESQTLFSYSFFNSPFLGNDFWKFNFNHGQKIGRNKLSFNIKSGKKKINKKFPYFNFGSRFVWEHRRDKKINFGLYFDRSYFFEKPISKLKPQLIFTRKLNQKLESQLGLGWIWKDSEIRSFGQTSDFRLVFQPLNCLKVGGGFKFVEPDYSISKDESNDFYGELKAALPGNLGLIFKWKNKNLSKMNHQIYTKIFYQW